MENRSGCSGPGRVGISSPLSHPRGCGSSSDGEAGRGMAALRVPAAGSPQAGPQGGSCLTPARPPPSGKPVARTVARGRIPPKANWGIFASGRLLPQSPPNPPSPNSPPGRVLPRSFSLPRLLRSEMPSARRVSAPGCSPSTRHGQHTEARKNKKNNNKELGFPPKALLQSSWGVNVGDASLHPSSWPRDPPSHPFPVRDPGGTSPSFLPVSISARR